MKIWSTTKKKRFLYGTVFILLAMLLSSLVSAGNSDDQSVKVSAQERIRDVIVEYVPSNVLDAAVEGLDIWGDAVLSLTTSRATRKSSDKENLRLGTPYEVFTLSDSYVKNFEGVREDTVVSRNRWLFPVLMEDATLCWMRVQYINGKWVSTGVGGSGNAKLIENLSNRISIKTQKRAVIDLDFSNGATVVVWDEKGTMEDGRYYSLSELEDSLNGSVSGTSFTDGEAVKSHDMENALELMRGSYKEPEVVDIDDI